MGVPTFLAKWLLSLRVAPYSSIMRNLLGDDVRHAHHFNRRIIASPCRRLVATQRLLDAALEPDVIDLSMGAPPPRPEVAAGLPAIAPRESGSAYPPMGGFPWLRQAIADRLASDNLHYRPMEQVLVCNGVSQAIGLMLDTFVDPGDRVTLFTPCFLMYTLAVAHRRARPAYVPTWVENGRLRFDENRLRRCLRGSRVLFVNSPNNPTGGVFMAPDLERIAHWCHKHDVLIFSDDVYKDFQYEGESVRLASFRDAVDRTILADSFSKSHGLAALRVGYVAGPRALVKAMGVSSLATAPFVSAEAQRQALAALATPLDGGWLENYRRRRDRIAAKLRAAEVPFAWPAGAFYFWLPVGHSGMTGREFATRLLARERVVVIPGDLCGPDGENFVRLSYAGPEARLDEGIHRLIHFATQPSIIPIAARHAKRRAA